MAQGLDGRNLGAALAAPANAEDESIRDLRRALHRPEHEQDVGRSSSLPAIRSRDDLLEPELGRALQDVAQPGGFRRHHVRQAAPENAQRGWVKSTLAQLLQPQVGLSFLGDVDDAGKPRGECRDFQQMTPHRGASNLATTIVILKCCFGSACLIVPAGMKTAGIVVGPICLIVVYIFLLSSMLKLIQCRRAHGRPARFEELGKALGSRGEAYIVGAVIFLAFGFNCIWCVTCSENASMVLPDWSDTARLWIWAPLVAPLTLIRRLEFLTVTNLIGIVLVAATFICLIYVTGHELQTSGVKPVILADTQDLNTLLWVGTCGYIFELIHTVLPIYEAAENKETMPKLLVGTTLAVITLYIGLGVAFYCAFGEATADLATLNLDKNSAVGRIFPLVICFVGVVTMPLNSFVINHSYERLFQWSENHTVRKHKKNAVRIVVLLCIFVVTWLGGQQLQNFLALVGGLLGANISIVIPNFLHLAMCKPTGLARVWDIACIVFGVLMMALSTYQALSSWK